MLTGSWSLKPILNLTTQQGNRLSGAVLGAKSPAPVPPDTGLDMMEHSAGAGRRGVRNGEVVLHVKFAQYSFCSIDNSHTSHSLYCTIEKTVQSDTGLYGTQGFRMRETRTPCLMSGTW